MEVLLWRRAMCSDFRSATSARSKKLGRVSFGSAACWGGEKGDGGEEGR